MSNESEISNAIVPSENMPVSNVPFEVDLLKEIHITWLLCIIIL